MRLLDDILMSAALRLPMVKALEEERRALGEEKRTLREYTERLKGEVAQLQAKLAERSAADAGAPLDHLHPTIQQKAATSKYRYFLVTSWGHAASIWYAGSLNLHEDVLSNVGVDHPIQSFNAYWMNVDGKALLARSTPETFKYGANVPQPMSDGIRPAGFDLPSFDIAPRDYDKVPSFVFDEMEMIAADTPAKFIGSVHGTTLGQLSTGLAADPGLLKHRQFPLMNLIRHPIGRTESAIKATVTYHMNKPTVDIDSLLDERPDEARALEREYKVDFTEPRARAALHVFRQGLQNLVWAWEIRDFPRVRTIKMELLQSDPSYFAAAFHDLTSGLLTADQAYLDRVFTPENLGQGRRGRDAPSSRPAEWREQFDLWSDFERAEFRRIVDEHNLREIYASQDYDLSFV